MPATEPAVETKLNREILHALPTNCPSGVTALAKNASAWADLEHLSVRINKKSTPISPSRKMMILKITTDRATCLRLGLYGRVRTGNVSNGNCSGDCNHSSLGKHDFCD